MMEERLKCFDLMWFGKMGCLHQHDLEQLGPYSKNNKRAKLIIQNAEHLPMGASCSMVIAFKIMIVQTHFLSNGFEVNK